ncbi:MAG: replication-associated recombination protein A [Legionella sp.]|nr:replication-associated recombination protein A [Legionella sp.]
MKNIESIPLAESLRPNRWQDVIGQSHLLGEGKPLRLAFESTKPYSMIFWGPPGVGKTSLARICAHTFNCEWIALSAVLAGVKDIRLAVETARKNLDNQKQTILFIDEIHRFNKSQQDALLPFTESGLFILIGATTENPSFEIISALLSRAQVYVLKALSHEELLELLNRAHRKALIHLKFNEPVKLALIHHADGDARRLINLLQQLDSAASAMKTNTITLSMMQNALSPSFNRRFDKKGDDFYDQISALHKSVRGSHPDAALYWFCRMVDGGIDIHYLSRRIIRMAWEDIGLADLRAMQVANDAANTFDRLGSPEGELALAQAVIYLSIAPKSNAGYLAFNQAMAFVQQDKSQDVPLHIRNAPTKLMKELNYGHAYRYAHDEPHGYAAGETYLPDGMHEPEWYRPVDRGLEIKIGEKLAWLRQLDSEYLSKK